MNVEGWFFFFNFCFINYRSLTFGLIKSTETDGDDFVTGETTNQSKDEREKKRREGNSFSVEIDSTVKRLALLIDLKIV